MPHTYEYPRPSVTVDCVIFRLSPDSGRLQVLLIERGGEPFKGCWAVPGGFVDMNESLAEAAARELREETGVQGVGLYLEQLYTFGEPARDPRGRVISVAYVALLNTKVAAQQIQAGSDARKTQWFDIGEPSMTALPKLAFDHDHVVAKAIERVSAKARYAPIVFELLPEKFTLAEVRQVFVALTGHEPDPRHFRRQVEAIAGIKRAGERKTGRRPATLYRFDALKHAGHEFHL